MPNNDNNPILNPVPREHESAEDNYTLTEVQLANRNSGIPLEVLRHDVTPVGMHYLLTHFDIPYAENRNDWNLAVMGLVSSEQALTLNDLEQMPVKHQVVTMECAGNGRTSQRPRWRSMPWTCEAVGTAKWTGTSLRHIFEVAGLDQRATTIVFSGADSGIDGGHVHRFERSLSIEQAMQEEVMLAWKINDQELPPQHGYPLRLVVPGWYGMASVKWLNKITVTDKPFEGYQQVKTYTFRQSADEPGVPVSHMRVRSLMIPPGIPDWYSRRRLLSRGQTRLRGRAWSGAGVAVETVQVAIQTINGESLGSGSSSTSNDELQWVEANLQAPTSQFSWQGWHFDWTADPGHYRLLCRATNADGQVQPLEPLWDRGGFGNNAVQSMDVWVEDELPGNTSN